MQDVLQLQSRYGYDHNYVRVFMLAASLITAYLTGLVDTVWDVMTILPLIESLVL